MTLEDGESGEQIDLDTSDPKVRARFNEMAGKRQEEARKILLLAGADDLELDTGRAYMPALLQFFANRNKRHR